MATIAEYAAEYRQAGAKLREAVQGMTREQLIARPVPGKWSTLEVVAHLADFDPVIADRIKQIIATENPLLPAADEKLYAKELHYQERDLGEELAVIDAVRASTARLIAALKPEQLARVGHHSVRGPLTLEKLIQMGIGHIAHHLPFIAEKRKALGI